MALGLSRHAEVAQRIGLPQASRPVAAPKPHSENAKIPDSSNVPPSSPAGSLFGDNDDDDVPKLGLNDESVRTGGPSPPAPEPTPRQAPTTSLPSEASNTGVSATAKSERPRPVKSKSKGKVATTAPKPTSSRNTSSRPPVILSSQQQAALYVTKRTPSWAGGQGRASTLIPGNASVSGSASPTVEHTQPSGGPTAHSTLNQPSDASISSGPPANPRTQATHLLPPNRPASTGRVTFAPAASSLPGSSSNQIPPASQTSRGPSTSQHAIPPPNTAASTTPAGHTTSTVAPSAQPTTSTRSSVPPAGANATATTLPKYSANGRFPPTIPVCTVPADFVPPPPPSLCLPPPRVFYNYTPAQLVQIAQAQGSAPFPTQPAPLSCVSPTWLSKPHPRQSASTGSTQRVQVQQGIPQTSTAPVVPPLHRVVSEQTMRPPQLPVHAQQVHGAYTQAQPAQPAATHQVYVQPGQYTYATPVTRPASSVPAAQPPRGIPRVASASRLSQSHIPPPVQYYAPCAANDGDAFSVDAWRANSPMQYSPPLAHAQPYYGYPATQAPPAHYMTMAGPSHSTTTPAMPSNLSYGYTMPSAPTAHKRHVEEIQDDEIQEIPPPHKRFRGQ
ncbi:hypothetical protein FRC10_004361 [Ceratobasidium sp. 414]|nr:hypothetical protein FRC10_004361 [Ceratobasidium sp. 414]